VKAMELDVDKAGVTPAGPDDRRGASKGIAGVRHGDPLVELGTDRKAPVQRVLAL